LFSRYNKTMPYVLNKSGERRYANNLLRPTIAFFNSSPGGETRFEKWLLWRGIAESVREWDINLIYVSGEEFETHPQSVLYDLINSHNVDGIISWNSFVGPRSPTEKVRAFYGRYHPIPVISIELTTPESSNLLVDNAQGVRLLLSHLIEHHGYRKIAFITEHGNHTAYARQVAFEEFMKQQGVFDPLLVGDLRELGARNLKPGVDYQAVVARSDRVAAESIDYLLASGVRVPEDVAVVGFNDGEEARGSLPPLTTVRLPFRNLGRHAVELLNRHIRGEVIPEQVFLPLQLALRRSCGCLEPMAEQAAVDPVPFTGQSLQSRLLDERLQIQNELARGVGTSLESLSNLWAARLLEIFMAEIEWGTANPECQKPSEKFLRQLYDVLRQALADGSTVSRWHEALTTLRHFLLPSLEGRMLGYVENMFQQARVLVGQTSVRAEINRGWQAARRSEILHEIESALLMSFDFNEVLDILEKGLGGLGISDFYLVLYEGQFTPQSQAKLVLAYENGRRVAIDPNSQVFTANRILPDEWLPADRSYRILVEALHVRDEQIGFIVFKTDPPADAAYCDIYRTLSLQISSAIKGVRLRKKLQEALC